MLISATAYLFYIISKLQKFWLEGSLSDEITISRGAEQSCPLSPLLFIILVEMLAVALRNQEKKFRDKDRKYED